MSHYNLEIQNNILTVQHSGELHTNKQIEVVVATGVSGVFDGEQYVLAEDYTLTFTSKYCPLFSTLSRVKVEAGPDADLLTDIAIYRMIYKNSLDAIDICNLNYNTNVGYTYFGCGDDLSIVPTQLRRYVECKTAYDILQLLRMVNSSSGGGNQLKSLGDMTIKLGGGGGVAGGGLASDPTKLKDLRECWKYAMEGIRNLGSTVRGYFDKTKGYSHPVLDTKHNRIIRAVDHRNADPSGPWVRSTDWRSFNTKSRRSI